MILAAIAAGAAAGLVGLGVRVCCPMPRKRKQELQDKHEFGYVSDEQHSNSKRIESVNTRMTQLGQALQERAQWQEAATAGLVHLTEPLNKLLGRRGSLREALHAWPGVADTTRYVVVMGHAGVGKSTFIKQQLSEHGYADLASDMVLHSDKPVPYMMHQHGVLLLDSVGDAGGGTALLQGEALAADVLVVFLGQGCRGERMHGDAAALAYRMRHQMRTIFVVSKTDTIILEGASEEGTHAGVCDLLRGMKRKAAAELQRMLVGCDGSVKARTLDQVPPVAVADDTNSILRMAEAMCPEEWCNYVEAADWLMVVCYCRSSAITGGGRGGKLQPVEAEVMQQELSAMEGLVYPLPQV